MTEEDAKSRLRLVVGDEGVARLDASCVAVFGIGGVGSNCAEALVRGGVGSLIVVDSDVVAPSNINRQAVAYVSTVGRPKVEVMAALAAEINPEARVFCKQAFVLGNVAEVLAGLPRPDYIVDAIDTVAGKIALALYAQEQGIPIIAAMGGANKKDPTALRFADLFKTQYCPLCKAMRKQAKAAGIERLPVLYSSEQPIQVEGGALGTMSYFPPIMGQMLAGRVICDLLNEEALHV